MVDLQKEEEMPLENYTVEIEHVRNGLGEGYHCFRGWSSHITCGEILKGGHHMRERRLITHIYRCKSIPLQIPLLARMFFL